MAQIVLIDQGTFKKELNEVGDIVSRHDDKTKLGSAYSTFKIVRIDGISIKEFENKINAFIPEQKRVFKTTSTKWSFDIPKEKEAWKDKAGKWKFIEKRPKYSLRLDFTQIDIDKLKDSGIIKEEKLQIINDCTKEKISLDSKNNVEIMDLNT